MTSWVFRDWPVVATKTASGFGVVFDEVFAKQVGEAIRRYHRHFVEKRWTDTHLYVWQNCLDEPALVILVGQCHLDNGHCCPTAAKPVDRLTSQPVFAFSYGEASQSTSEPASYSAASRAGVCCRIFFSPSAADLPKEAPTVRINH